MLERKYIEASKKYRDAYLDWKIPEDEFVRVVERFEQKNPSRKKMIKKLASHFDVKEDWIKYRLFDIMGWIF